MKNLYRLLAVLMCTCFLTITGALMLNKAIDETVANVDSTFDEITKVYSESLKDAKISHNLYFINCFPNVCAKVSFGRYQVTTKETTDVLDEKGEFVREKEIIKTDRFDLGVTDFIVAKYSPITGKIKLDLNANNIILMKNNEKLGSAFFKKINYESSSDIFSYYKSLFTKDQTAEDVIKSLNKKSDLTIAQPRAAYEDLRVKADSFKLMTKSFDVTDTAVSSAVEMSLKALSINNEDTKLDVVYNLEIQNFDKTAVLEGIKLSKAKLFKLNSDDEEVQKQLTKDLLVYAVSVIDAIKNFDENKTVLKFSNVEVKEYSINEKNKAISDFVANAEVTLDDNLDLVGFADVKVIATKQKAKDDVESLEIIDPRSGVRHKLFAKQEDGSYAADVKFVEGKIILNGTQIDIKGQIKGIVDFASGMVNLMAMQANMK